MQNRGSGLHFPSILHPEKRPTDSPAPKKCTKNSLMCEKWVQGGSPGGVRGGAPRGKFGCFISRKYENFDFFCDPNRVCVGLRPMQPLSRATGASSLAVLSHFPHFLHLPPRSGGHFCVKGISLMLKPSSQEQCRIAMDQCVNRPSCWRAAACTLPPRSGGLCWRLLSLTSRHAEN